MNIGKPTPDEQLKEFMNSLKAGSEQRLNEQVRRHLKIDASSNPADIVDLHIKQEIERSRIMKKKYEDREQYAVADFIDRLVDEWLPELRRKFLSRVR